MRVLIVPLCLMIAGCQLLESSRLRADNSDELVGAVWSKIPAGTPITEAQTRMEAAGFECRMSHDYGFSEAPGFIGDDLPGYNFRSIDKTTYLSCSREESAGFLLTSMWTVAIVPDESGNVSDVLVRHRRGGL